MHGGHNHGHRRRRPPAGADPSTLAMATEGPGTLRALHYGPHSLEDRAVDISEVPALLQQKGVTWLDLASPDAAQLGALGTMLRLHPLAIADVAHPPQRPKYAPYAAFDFFVLATPRDDGVEQVGLFVGDGWVLTIRESSADPLEPVRERLRGRVGRIRERGAAFLAAALVMALVDAFFEPVEDMREQIEEMEDQVLGSIARPLFGRLHSLRRRTLGMRRVVGPMLEAILRAGREETPRWDADARLHLREAGEDARQVLEEIEATQASAASLGDLYLSVLGSRTNEVVTVLTLVSTIFLPMTFLTGVWGMNFRAMPELQWQWGYAFAWALIGLSALVQVLLFHRRGWFRRLQGPWGGGGLGESQILAARRRKRARARAARHRPDR